ncbi:glycosyltransferase [Phormidium sp. CLA17]|uniref:glycosyltransferase n=1 Tax=Leptolyngbya sp. Cla-17 TaxID=2803751 RepID=UPI001490AD22|nr:glycosyltransferase [Leptolyngbya sp. Cla-17]MBM0743433.1 glycosyltransferase [Leptolyngbya sp. Cla-17]
MNVDCIKAIAAPSVHWFPKAESHSLVQTPPLPQCEVCVIVPVRNESERLQSTLTALANQSDLAGLSLDPKRYEIILLANNCEDDSAAIAHRFAQQHPHLALHVVEETLSAANAHIGWVRKLLMDEAYNRLISIGCSRGIIASTDGDTRVAPNWIAATLQEIDCGADAVGGRIVTDRRDRAALTPYTRACHLREVGYRFLVAELEAHLDPDALDVHSRHFQHYGASLAVTAEMYGRAGGIPPVRTSEDVALYQALMRIDASFRHSPLVRATTSARQVGRAQHGLADQLSQWTAMEHEKQSFLVESAAAITTRLHAQRELRSLWQHRKNGYEPTLKDVAMPADRLGITKDWVRDQLVQAQFFGELFEQVEQRQEQEGIWQQRWFPSKIEQAIDDLRLLLEPVRQQRRKVKQTSMA